LIIFDRYNPVETFWELGLPFLKKEKLFFDLQDENLGVCVNEPNTIKQSSTYVLIYAAIIIFLAAAVIGLICQMPKKGRKKRVNELNEELEYSKSLN
jgi:hypothetical protein